MNHNCNKILWLLFSKFIYNWFFSPVMAVEVSDTVPVVAFGYPVPLFHNRSVVDVEPY